MSKTFQRNPGMAHTILRLPDVKARTGLSRSSIYAYVEKGTFPKPVKLAERSVGWLADDIECWIVRRAEASGIENIG